MISCHFLYTTTSCFPPPICASAESKKNQILSTAASSAATFPFRPSLSSLIFPSAPGRVVIRKLLHTFKRAQSHEAFQADTQAADSCCGKEKEQNQKRILEEEESISSFPAADRGWACLAPIILSVHACTFLRQSVRGVSDEAGGISFAPGQSWGGENNVNQAVSQTEGTMTAGPETAAGWPTTL